MSNDPHPNDEKSNFVFKDKHAGANTSPEGSWFPHPYEYQGKTMLTPEQAERLVKLRWYVLRFEDDILCSDEILSMITEYEATSPSIFGESRKQQTAILSGGKMGDKLEGIQRYLGLSAPDDDDD